MNTTSPTLEEIKARRRKLAEEDRVLAEIERGLEDIARKWQSYWVSNVGNIVATDTRDDLFTTGTFLLASKVPAPIRTKNQMIIEALNSPRPVWQTAKQIQESIVLLFGKKVPMSSISPALSALKKDETIVRSDKVVALALRLHAGQTNEAPPGQSESASKPEDTGVSSFSDPL